MTQMTKDEVEADNEMCHPPDAVELLILGAGWTSDFLIPLLKEKGVSYAATSTTGRDGTIPFKYDPDSEKLDAYRSLPVAKTILITFPLKNSGQSQRLVDNYNNAHAGDGGLQQSRRQAHWIQLGSTSIYNEPTWSDYTSPYDRKNARAVAEDELIELGNSAVLNLAGLWGGTRQPRNWLGRVAKSKEDVRAKKLLHLIHGKDVARVVVGACGPAWENLKGTRWIVTDLHVYDWWDVMFELGPRAEKMEGGLEWREVIVECMKEDGVRALPRDVESLGRALDARAVWGVLGITPSMGREWMS